MSVIESTKLAPAGTWAADPVHSNVSFGIGYSGVNTFRGSFTDRPFSDAVGGDAGPRGSSAKVASVDVKDEQLNGHLRRRISSTRSAIRDLVQGHQSSRE